MPPDGNAPAPSPNSIFVIKHYWFCSTDVATMPSLMGAADDGLGGDPTPTVAKELRSRPIEAMMLLGLIGRPNKVSSQELCVLEKGFIHAFNKDKCGDRGIENVTIDSTPLADDSQGSNMTQRSLQASTKTTDLAYFFQMSDRCRKCGAKPCLNGKSARQWLMDDGPASRHLQNDACLPPSEDKFLSHSM